MNLFEDDRGHETWEYPDGEFCCLCPKCNTGILVWMSVFDWPYFLGGEWLDQIIRCTRCGTVWEFEASFPPGTFDDKEQLIGWSQNGYYINGCEGPIRMDKRRFFVQFEVQDRDTFETMMLGGKEVLAYRREEAGSLIAEQEGKYGFVTVWEIEEV